MANAASLVRAVADQFGLREPKILRSMEESVEEATLDILSRADGRFVELKRSQSITTVAATPTYDTEKDFNTPYMLMLLNSEDVPIDSVGIVDLSVIIERRRLGRDVSNLCYFDNNPGKDFFTLTFAKTPAAGVNFRLDYFRFPVAGDVVLIKNEQIIKKYIRSQLPPEINPFSGREFSTYEKLRDTYSNRAVAIARGKLAQPKWQTQDHNENMGVWGSGVT